MNAGHLLILCLLFVIIIYSLWETIRQFRYNRFQENMKVTDKCLFKTDSCWEPGKIIAIYNGTVIIEDEDGESHMINRDEIRPYSKIW